jgi:arsenate reductase
VWTPALIEVMQEIGIDISSQRSKKAREFQDILFDLAVTVCDRAKQACPILQYAFRSAGFKR